MKYNTWINILLLLSILFILVIIYKKTYIKLKSFDGFTQKENFVLNKEDKIYDDFYTVIYDKISIPHRHVPFEIKTVLKTTDANIENSIILDIGSGTGFLVSQLTELGYKAYGLDKSEAMVNYSTKKYPNISVKNEDAMNTICYEKNTFSHIFCVYYTIYSIKERIDFFRNCYYWLKPGGYLILHLIDPLKFDTTPPCGKDPIFGSPKRYIENNSNDSIVLFDDFKYKVSYNYNKKRKEAIMTESMTDIQTNRVRQNEQTLYMEEIKIILSELNYCGFISHAKFEYSEDKNQFLYIIERET